MLENKVTELEAEIERLKRKMEGCPECRYYIHKQEETFQYDHFRPNYE